MKTLNIKYLILVIFFIISSAIYSQSDSEITYYPNNVTIEYDGGMIKNTNISTGKTTMIPNLIRLNDVSKIRFLSDSLISITNETNTEMKININKINEVSIKEGSYFWEGAGIGVLLGLGVVLIISSGNTETNTYTTEPYGNLFKPFDDGIEGAGNVVLGFLSVLGGGLIGGIIGGNIHSYESFDMQKYTYDQKLQLQRILLIYKNKRQKK